MTKASGRRDNRASMAAWMRERQVRLDAFDLRCSGRTAAMRACSHVAVRADASVATQYARRLRASSRRACRRGRRRPCTRRLSGLRARHGRCRWICEALMAQRRSEKFEAVRAPPDTGRWSVSLRVLVPRRSRLLRLSRRAARTISGHAAATDPTHHRRRSTRCCGLAGWRASRRWTSSLLAGPAGRAAGRAHAWLDKLVLLQLRRRGGRASDQARPRARPGASSIAALRARATTASPWRALALRRRALFASGFGPLLPTTTARCRSTTCAALEQALAGSRRRGFHRSSRSRATASILPDERLPARGARLCRRHGTCW